MPLIGAGLVQNSGQVAADETEKMDLQRWSVVTTLGDLSVQLKDQTGQIVKTTPNQKSN